jgi:20S proteasome alpha/beta subunit
MTTIIGDWRRKVLVADSQFTDSDTGIKYFEDKIFPIEGGFLGVAGNYVDAEKVIDYLSKKSKNKSKLRSRNKTSLKRRLSSLYNSNS